LEVRDAIGSAAGERDYVIQRPKFARPCCADGEDAQDQRVEKGHGPQYRMAQRHDRENASISVKTATRRARQVGWSDHYRVRRNTIAKRQTTAVRLQKVCMA